MAALLFPFANTTAQWYGSTAGLNTPMAYVEKIVLHTTEGPGWPGYKGGTEAPHLTWLYLPGTGRQIRQHFAFDQISRALVHAPGGIPTNGDGCIQIELVGTCDPRATGAGMYWPGAPDAALQMLAADLAWLCAEFGLPRTFVPLWLPYPASYGVTAARLSGPAFDAYRGILGHQHVPQNDHGDPGALNIARLKQLMPSTAPGSSIPNVTPIPGDDVSEADVISGMLKSIDPAGTPSFAKFLGDLVEQRVSTALVNATNPALTPSFLAEIRQTVHEEVAALPTTGGTSSVSGPTADEVADKVVERIKRAWSAA